MYRVIIAAVVLTAANSASIPPRIDPGVIPNGDKIETYPYQVSIMQHGQHQCSGVILGQFHVLTNGHCMDADSFKHVKWYQVRVGSALRSEGGKIHALKDYVHHPQYETTYLRYDNSFDLVVAILNKPIKFGPSAQPIALVRANEEPEAYAELTTCGWGGAGWDVLHGVKILTVDLDECKELYKFYENKITPQMICAGGSRKTIYAEIYAPTDRGAPLINNENHLVGIHSFHHVVQNQVYPGVYVNLADSKNYDFVVQYINKTTNTL